MPDPPTPRTAGAHDVASVDIGRLTIDQRAALELLLRADGVGHEFDGDLLRVPATAVSNAQMLIDDATSREFDPRPPHEQHRRYASFARAIAGVLYPRPWRRLGAALIDAIVLGVPVALLARSGAWLAGEALTMVYAVALTSLTGQTLGKMVLRIRVVDERSARNPTAWRSVVRWFVVAGIATALQAIPGPVEVRVAFAIVATVVAVAVVVPILADPRRRGLHDRAAGTVVVDAVRRRGWSGDELVGVDVEELPEPT